MFPKTKKEWARMLAGQGIKDFLEENNINTYEDLDEYMYDDQEIVYETFREICGFYISEMNDEDSLFNNHIKE